MAQSDTSAPQWKTSRQPCAARDERAPALQVSGRDLHVERLQKGGVAPRAHQAAHLPALPHQALRQMAADEPRGAGDQADVVARGIDGLAPERRVGRGVGGLRRPAPQRRGGDVAHDAPVLARGAVAVGEDGVERAQEAARLRLGQGQRRQQLDHVVLARRHRDHPVVAVQRDHDQLREEPLAGEVDQPPVEPGDARARRAQLDPDHEPAPAHLLDHLVALRKLGEPLEEHRADARGVLDQAVALDDAQRRQAGRHRQAIAPVRRLVHVAALERADRPVVDLATGDHGGHGHVAAAQRLADEDDVGLEAPVLQREPPAGAPEPGLDLVEDEQGAVAPAERLRPLQVARRHGGHEPALDRLDDEGRDVLGAQLRLQGGEVAVGNELATGQQRAEALLEELVAHHRERPERDAVKAALARDQARSPGRRARELHGGVHGLGPGAREEDGIEGGRQAPAELLGEHARQRRVVQLDAVDEIGGQRGLQDLADSGMVVAQAREALAGVEVEVGAPGGVVEVGALSGDVLLVEAEDPQHVDQVGIHVARGERQRVARARPRVGDDAEAVRRVGWREFPFHRGADLML